MTAADPNPGRMTLTGSFDTVSTDMFRGIRQDSTGVAFWLAADLGLAAGGTGGFGAWNVHGGGEHQALGDTTKAFNGGDSSRVIGSKGIGFSY